MSHHKIRPIAICIFRHQDRILVFEGYDSVKKELFYRPLGGSIEFGEHSSIAVKREIKEELGAEICNITFLGSLENIFEGNGKPGHEFVQVYEADFAEPRFYQTDSPEAFEDDGSEIKAIWKEIAFFENGEAPLYPNGLLDLLLNRTLKSTMENNWGSAK
jgi:8-oxo-dGTP pyrophosphatase MutT (NUDIX family)